MTDKRTNWIPSILKNHAQAVLKIIRSPILSYKSHRNKPKIQRNINGAKYYYRTNPPIIPHLSSPSRRSLLTITSISSPPVQLPSLNPQNNSPLFSKLPLELRQLIWDFYVRSGSKIHLVVKEDRKGARLKAIYCSSMHQWVEAETWGAWNGYMFCELSGNELHEGQVNLVPLLLTCRLIYNELLKTFLNKNTFLVTNEEIIQFIPLFLLPSRISSLHSLTFNWVIPSGPPLISPISPTSPRPSETSAEWTVQWFTIWAQLSSMRNLRELGVNLSFERQELWEKMGRRELRGLVEVIRGLSRYGEREWVLRVGLLRSRVKEEVVGVWEGTGARVVWAREELEGVGALEEIWWEMDGMGEGGVEG